MRWLALLFAPLALACGDTDGEPGPEPAVDAGVTDPDVGQVQIAAYTRTGQADPGVTLLVHDAGGALVGRATTAATGLARLAVPVGGQVTAIQGTGAERTLTTITDVRPGDELRFGLAPRTGPTTTAHRYDLTFDLHPGATSYTYVTSCGEHRNPFDGEHITFTAYCPVDQMRVTVVAHGQGQPVAHASVMHPPFGGAIHVAGPYEPVGSLPVRVADIGADGFTVSPVLPTGSDQRIPLFSESRSGGVANVPLIGAGTGIAIHVRDQAYTREVFERLDATPALAEIELAAAPILSRVALDGRSLRWSTQGPAIADGVVATVSRPGVTWHGVVRGDAVTWFAPELPEDLAHLSPVGVAATPVVRGFDLSWAAGWDDFRASGHADTMDLGLVVGLGEGNVRALVSTSRTEPTF